MLGYRSGTSACGLLASSWLQAAMAKSVCERLWRAWLTAGGLAPVSVSARFAGGRAGHVGAARALPVRGSAAAEGFAFFFPLSRRRSQL